jgi:hypothetical protein
LELEDYKELLVKNGVELKSDVWEIFHNSLTTLPR